MKRILIALLFMLTLVGVHVVSSSIEGAAPVVIHQDKKEETVYITRTGEKYHLGHCRYLRKSKIPISKKNAKARGYTACKVCKP